MNNPLLDTLALPSFEEITPDMIGPALDVAVGEHEATITALTAARATDFASAWLPYERANTVLESLWATVSHLHGVADTPALRKAHAEAERRLVENGIKVGQNRDLYDMLVGLSASAEFPTLRAADRVAVEHAIRDFVLSGVALAPAERDRFRDITVELASLSNAFGSAVLDATEAWTELIVDEGRLAGVSDADKAMFRDAAEASGREGWLVTLRQPSITAIMTFCEHRELRARVYRAAGTRASDQGPNAGEFDNSARIARILVLRREAAELLGYPDAVALSLATKMATNAGEVMAFLRDIAARARPAAERDLAELTEFAADACDIGDLQPWDTAFVSNRLRQVRYAVDENATRAYFPVARVMEGWQELMERLFGIRLAERDDVARYHDDARYFDVIDGDGAVFAGLYVDLHARAGKQNGAWMSQARPRLRDGNTVTLPAAYLVANFAPHGDETPSLLRHQDVITLLHETGHCLHALFTRVDRPSVAGVNGFEWDAIELPSQLMEDFAWDRDVLTAMSGHHETGERLPAELFDRLSRARHFQAGMMLLRSVEFSLFDLLLHLGTLGSDPIEVIEAVQDEIAVTRPPAWHRFPHAFTHIFSGSYAAGYYSYLWAELLAADGFMAFADAGLVDRATGERFREEVLSRGASRPAADSYRAFRGRDPEPGAILVRHGLQ